MFSLFGIFLYCFAFFMAGLLEINYAVDRKNLIV